MNENKETQTNGGAASRGSLPRLVRCPRCGSEAEINWDGANGTNEVRGVFWQTVSAGCSGDCWLSASVTIDGDSNKSRDAERAVADAWNRMAGECPDRSKLKRAVESLPIIMPRSPAKPEPLVKLGDVMAILSPNDKSTSEAGATE